MTNIRCNNCDKLIVKAAVLEGVAKLKCECGHVQMIAKKKTNYEPYIVRLQTVTIVR